MTDIGAPPTTTHRTRFVQLVSHWWPVAAFIVISLVVQMRYISRYDVGGHAAEHLGSASAPFMPAAVTGILFWATPQALRYTATSTVTDIADHSLANSSIWWAVVAALVLVAAVRRRHHIDDAATVGAVLR